MGAAADSRLAEGFRVGGLLGSLTSLSLSGGSHVTLGVGVVELVLGGRAGDHDVDIVGGRVWEV